MEPKDINPTINKVNGLLRQGRIAAAMEQLTTVARDAGLEHIVNQVEQVKVSYQFLLRYFAQGVPDPHRDEVLQHIVKSLYDIVDSTYMALLKQNTAELVVVKQRELKSVALDTLFARLHEANDRYSLLMSVDEEQRDKNAVKMSLEQREQAETDVFNKIWTMHPLTSADALVISDALADKVLPDYAKAHVMAALLLGLAKCYDDAKLELLLKAYSESDSDEVQVRALVGAMLAIDHYRDRIAGNRNIALLVDAISTREHFVDDVNSIHMQLARSRNTSNITRRVREEIMPDLIKMRPEFLSKINDKQRSDNEERDINPEWEEWLEKSGFAERMEEFTDLQLEGGDVYISTFAMLKSFAFFQTLSNWFLPYHDDCTTVGRVFGDDTDNALRQIVGDVPNLCNSDKYSLCLSMGSVPQAQREFMLHQIEEQNVNLQELKAASLPVDRSRSWLVNRYVQDLYRFFMLYPRHGEFKPLFNGKFDFATLEGLAPLVTRPDTVQALAEFYFKNDFYADAITNYRRIIEAGGDYNPLCFQKTGYAHESLGHYDKAIECYERYLIFKDDDLWTLKHIAACLRTLKRYDEALARYEKVCQLKPDNVANILNVGHCLLEMGRHDEALQRYYQADLLDEKRHRAWRPIAWVSFLTNNFDRALDYYNRIVEDDTATSQDLLNRGHVLLAMQRVSDALDSYKRSLAACKDDKADFVKAFDADRDILIKHGVAPADIPLIIDTVTSNIL